MNFGGNTVQLKIPTPVHYTIKDFLTPLVYLRVCDTLFKIFQERIGEHKAEPGRQCGPNMFCPLTVTFKKSIA